MNKVAALFDKLIEFKDNRSEDLDYLKYLVKHKYYVYKGGSELDHNRLDLVKHDWSKFLPSLWAPYREHFFGTKYPKNSPLSLNEKEKKLKHHRFREAVKKHTKYESHHDYKYHNPEGKIKPTKENIADWWAVAEALDPDTPDIKKSKFFKN